MKDFDIKEKINETKTFSNVGKVSTSLSKVPSRLIETQEKKQINVLALKRLLTLKQKLAL